MEIAIKSYGKQLTPTSVENVLCDGSTIARVIAVPATADVSVWQEMTEGEAEALVAVNADPDAEATEADYQAALKQLGVNFDA